MTPGEEAIARAAKALPRCLLVSAHDGPDGFPLGLERLNRRGGSYPVARSRKCLSLLAQRQLLGEIADVHLALRRQVRRRAAKDLVLCGLEAAPHDLALRTRGQRNRLPARLDLAHSPAGYVEVLLARERLHFTTQRLLHLQVGPSLPFVRLSQFLRTGAQNRSRCLEPGLDVLSILLRRQRCASL